MGLDRRDFLKGTFWAAMAAVGGIHAAEGLKQEVDVEARQRELDAIPGGEFKKFRARASCITLSGLIRASF